MTVPSAPVPGDELEVVAWRCERTDPDYPWSYCSAEENIIGPQITGYREPLVTLSAARAAIAATSSRGVTNDRDDLVERFETMLNGTTHNGHPVVCAECDHRDRSVHTLAVALAAVARAPREAEL